MQTLVKDVGNFKVTFTEFVIKVDNENQTYYEVLIFKKDKDYPTYINLHKDKRFDFIDYTRPNKDTDKIEYRFYLDRKDIMQHPLWILNSTNFHKVLAKCEELSIGD